MSLILLDDHPNFSKENISLVATDMDGTLTRHGKFTSSLFKALEELERANISVLVVTGRSAGWVQGLRSYLPVTGAIAENGGIFFSNDSEQPKILTPIADLIRHRQHLAETFQKLKSLFPKITETADNRFRLTDWTFDIQGLTLPELEKLEELCAAEGWGFTYSNVQCHIKPANQDKTTSLLQVLKAYFPQLTKEQVITVGDSPNDETLFVDTPWSKDTGILKTLQP